VTHYQRGEVEFRLFVLKPLDGAVGRRVQQLDGAVRLEPGVTGDAEEDTQKSWELCYCSIHNNTVSG